MLHPFSKIFITFLFAIIFFSACQKIDSKQLIGNWGFVSFTDNNKKPLSIKPDLNLNFDDKSHYEYSSVWKNAEYSESGSYRLKGDLLYTTNSSKNKSEKAVQVLKLTQDTLVLKMKNAAQDIQLLTLVRVAEVQKSDAELEALDKEETEEKTPKKSKKK